MEFLKEKQFMEILVTIKTETTLDRVKGLEIARAAGQVDKIIGGVLTSEDLY